MKVIDLNGQRFGRLIAGQMAGRNKRRNTLWLCKCDCGKSCTIASNQLRSGRTRSCGCLMLDTAKTKGAATLRKVNTTHGMSGPLCDRDLTWVSWAAMIQRTSNPKNKSWADYGGRGIVPCEFIRATPVNLIAMIGPRLSREFSLGRRDNNRGYHCGHCPECIQKGFRLNVAWETRKEQNNNKRNVRRL